MRNKLISAPYLVWMLIFIIAPLIFVAYYAFTASDGSFTLDNISDLGNYLPTFFESIWLAAVAAAVCLLIAYPLAFFMSRMSPSAQRFLMLLVMLPMCMSFLLRTMAWVSLLSDQGIINSFIKSLGLEPLSLIRNRGAVILGMVYNYLPYMILPLYTVLIKLDRSLIEASSDLGASTIQTFRRVVLPLSVPGIVSGVTMVFVPAVSTFYISKKLGGTSLAMVGDIIETQFKNAYNPNLGAAMSLVLMLLIFICMGIMNRFSDNSGEAMIP